MIRVELRGDSERVLAADRDERVEPTVLEVLEDLVDRALHLVGVRAARADDRAAARQDSRDLLRPEVLEPALDEPAPAFQHRDAVPARGVPAPHDRPDDRVETGAVAAAGEDSDRSRHRPKSYRLAPRGEAGLSGPPPDLTAGRKRD